LPTREESSPQVNARRLNCVFHTNIAVADAGGGLVAHVRMDGAWLGSVDIAINKAWTARAFDMSTEDLSHFTQSGQQGFGLNTTNDSRVVIFGGGIPSRSME